MIKNLDDQHSLDGFDEGRSFSENSLTFDPLYLFNPVLFLLCRNTKRVESLDNCCAQMVAKEIKVLYSKGNQRPIYLCMLGGRRSRRKRAVLIRFVGF